MTATTSIKLEPAYKEKVFKLVLNVYIALVLGPVVIFMMTFTAVANKVVDPTSWIIICIASLLFSYLSYRRLKYLYRVYFCEHRAEIDFNNKSILFLPYKETVLIEKIATLIYITEQKNYVFQYKNYTTTSFEVKRNAELEKVLMQLSLECKVK